VKEGKMILYETTEVPLFVYWFTSEVGSLSEVVLRVTTLYTHLFELGFSSVCELLGKRVFIRLLSVTGDSSLRSE
jgi:hypothetical protein